MTPRSVSFVVTGIPQPKGSAKAFVPKKWADDAYRRGVAPRAVVTHDNPRTKGWQQLVADQAQKVAGVIFDGPTVLTVTFYLPRPQYLRDRIEPHVTPPDLDKLVRCVTDALTGILYHDDKQVVDLLARKFYARPSAAPHVQITLAEAAPPVAKAGALFD
jgi:Holliday junction resolvase RusA-like endonuclease